MDLFNLDSIETQYYIDPATGLPYDFSDVDFNFLDEFYEDGTNLFQEPQSQIGLASHNGASSFGASDEVANLNGSHELQNSLVKNLDDTSGNFMNQDMDFSSMFEFMEEDLFVNDYDHFSTPSQATSATVTTASPEAVTLDHAKNNNVLPAIEDEDLLFSQFLEYDGLFNTEKDNQLDENSIAITDTAIQAPLQHTQFNSPGMMANGVPNGIAKMPVTSSFTNNDMGILGSPMNNDAGLDTTYWTNVANFTYPATSNMTGQSTLNQTSNDYLIQNSLGIFEDQNASAYMNQGLEDFMPMYEVPGNPLGPQDSSSPSRFTSVHRITNGENVRARNGELSLPKKPANAGKPYFQNNGQLDNTAGSANKTPRDVQNRIVDFHKHQGLHESIGRVRNNAALAKPNTSNTYGAQVAKDQYSQPHRGTSHAQSSTKNMKKSPTNNTRALDGRNTTATVKGAGLGSKNFITMGSAPGVTTKSGHSIAIKSPKPSDYLKRFRDTSNVDGDGASPSAKRQMTAWPNSTPEEDAAQAAAMQSAMDMFGNRFDDNTELPDRITTVQSLNGAVMPLLAPSNIALSPTLIGLFNEIAATLTPPQTIKEFNAAVYAAILTREPELAKKLAQYAKFGQSVNNSSEKDTYNRPVSDSQQPKAPAAQGFTPNMLATADQSMVAAKTQTANKFQSVNFSSQNTQVRRSTPNGFQNSNTPPAIPQLQKRSPGAKLFPKTLDYDPSSYCDLHEAFGHLTKNCPDKAKAQAAMAKSKTPPRQAPTPKASVPKTTPPKSRSPKSTKPSPEICTSSSYFPYIIPQRDYRSPFTNNGALYSQGMGVKDSSLSAGTPSGSFGANDIISTEECQVSNAQTTAAQRGPAQKSYTSSMIAQHGQGPQTSASDDYFGSQNLFKSALARHGKLINLDTDIRFETKYMPVVLPKNNITPWVLSLYKGMGSVETKPEIIHRKPIYSVQHWDSRFGEFNIISYRSYGSRDFGVEVLEKMEGRIWDDEWEEKGRVNDELIEHWAVNGWQYPDDDPMLGRNRVSNFL
jgi:hypothetical protein